jgi:hypothetical protein
MMIALSGSPSSITLMALVTMSIAGEVFSVDWLIADRENSNKKARLMDRIKNHFQKDAISFLTSKACHYILNIVI